MAGWDHHSLTFQLTGVRVVAMLDEGGGAIVQEFEALEIDEGRVESYGTDGLGQSVAGLDYALFFRTAASEEGNNHVEYPARVVIRGTNKDDRLVEIRGEGFIGHDERGQVTGSFHDLPAMYIPTFY